MNKKAHIDEVKNKLRAKESSTRKKLSGESDDFEEDLFKSVKIAGYVSAGLLIGYALFRIVAPKKKVEPTIVTQKNKDARKAPDLGLKKKALAFLAQIAISFVAAKFKEKIDHENDSPAAN